LSAGEPRGRTESGIAFEATGSGPPVLLIHAGITDRTMWDPQWDAWGERLTLIRYAQRGFGDSDDPVRPYSLHGDALAVLDAVGADPGAVIGASIGGRAALDLTLAAPQRVTALVAVVATPSGWEPDVSLAADFARVEAAYEAGGVEAANEVELEIWVDGPGRMPGSADPATRERAARLNRDALQREEARERAEIMIEPDPLDPPALYRLGELTTPAIVVTGEHDQPSVNAGAAAMAVGIAAAEAAEIPATAHLPSLERPAAFEAAVMPFLARHAAG
jgi:pimeloyl-ACP methyl ester carboxylesterase